MCSPNLAACFWLFTVAKPNHSIVIDRDPSSEFVRSASRTETKSEEEEYAKYALTGEILGLQLENIQDVSNSPLTFPGSKRTDTVKRPFLVLKLPFQSPVRFYLSVTANVNPLDLMA